MTNQGAICSVKVEQSELHEVIICLLFIICLKLGAFRPTILPIDFPATRPAVHIFVVSALCKFSKMCQTVLPPVNCDYFFTGN